MDFQRGSQNQNRLGQNSRLQSVDGVMGVGGQPRLLNLNKVVAQQPIPFRPNYNAPQNRPVRPIPVQSAPVHSYNPTNSYNNPSPANGQPPASAAYSPLPAQQQAENMPLNNYPLLLEDKETAKSPEAVVVVGNSLVKNLVFKAGWLLLAAVVASGSYFGVRAYLNKRNGPAIQQNLAAALNTSSDNNADDAALNNHNQQVAGASTTNKQANQNDQKTNSLLAASTQPEQATIALYNDTSVAALAGKQSTAIQAAGSYAITMVADMPNKTNAAKTVVVDLTGGKKPNTLRYLENRYSTTGLRSLPNSSLRPGQVDFVIIIGQDAKNIP